LFDQIEQLEEVLVVGVFLEDVAEALNEPSAVMGVSGKKQTIKGF
jgi:hypothetical protein